MSLYGSAFSFFQFKVANYADEGEATNTNSLVSALPLVNHAAVSSDRFWSNQFFFAARNRFSNSRYCWFSGVIFNAFSTTGISHFA